MPKPKDASLFHGNTASTQILRSRTHRVSLPYITMLGFKIMFLQLALKSCLVVSSPRTGGAMAMSGNPIGVFARLILKPAVYLALSASTGNHRVPSTILARLALSPSPAMTSPSPHPSTTILISAITPGLIISKDCFSRIGRPYQFFTPYSHLVKHQDIPTSGFRAITTTRPARGIRTAGIRSTK